MTSTFKHRTLLHIVPVPDIDDDSFRIENEPTTATLAQRVLELEVKECRMSLATQAEAEEHLDIIRATL